MPAWRDSSSRPGRLASVGCGRSGAAVDGRLLAQHPDHLAQVLQRLVRAGAHDAGGARDLLGRRVGAELERARVHAQQRDAVGEHVVHLARDPRALVLACLLDAQLLLGLRAVGPLAQRRHELAPRTHEHAPRDRGDRDEQDEHDRDPQRVVGVRDAPRCRSASVASPNALTATTTEKRRWTATVNRASAPAADENAENAPITEIAIATWTGQRRRHHSSRQAMHAADDVGEEQLVATACRSLPRCPPQPSRSAARARRTSSRRANRAASAWGARRPGPPGQALRAASPTSVGSMAAAQHLPKSIAGSTLV